MYQKNLKNYYNRHYGRGKADQADQYYVQNKKMLEEDSEDEYTSNKDKESFATEQKFASFMFLVTIAILLVKLYKLASTSFQTVNARQWWSTVKFPDFRMDSAAPNPEADVKLLSPVLWGLGVAATTWMMVYFDSHTPGVNPRHPTRKQLLNPLEWPFAYWTALLSGVLVFLTVLVLEV